MTVTPTEPQPGSEVAVPGTDMTGLEDFDLATDAVMPRITITHKKGLFKDNLTNQEFPQLRAVLLGLVKQRILWHTTLDDNDKPMCKSPDFDFGFPTLEGNNGKTFPWEKSGFNAQQFPPNENGFVQLPCANCALKEWGSHPDGKKPYCSEQHTFPILYDPTGESGDDVSGWIPGLFTIQKTGIKPSKQYVTSFVRSRTPLYTAITEITLSQQSRGQTDFAVPSFKKLGGTPDDLWPNFSQTYRSTREFIRSHPTTRDDDGATPSDNAWEAPPEEAPAQAVAQGQPVAEQPATPVAAPAASAPTPAVAAPAAPAQPVAPTPAPTPEPAAPVAAPASAVPTEPAPAPAAPAPTPAATQPAASAPDDDDLPF